MESVDSSPNYGRPRSRFDAKKENSPGGSEPDEIMSMSSSTRGSTVDESFARKYGIKYRTSNRKNFGSVRSFRRRAKPRLIQSPLPISDDESSLTGSSEASPHYLKATTSSQGKKTRSQASPRPSESTFDGSDKNSSHSSQPKIAPSRTSSLRNVRILLKRTSFKPKRSLLRYSEVSEDVGVDRATYSSTLKDSKFPVPMEVNPGLEEPEKSSAMKVCRYHHCSLHGHCHGNDDATPPLKRFLYKRRQSMKKQKSMMVKTESVSRGKQSSNNRKKSLHKSQIVPHVEEEQVNPERLFSVSGVENENGFVSEENYLDEETKQFGGDLEESYLVEVAFGEMSFPERSYEDSLNISRKYASEEKAIAGKSSYCLRCSCHIGEVTTTPIRAEADLSTREITSSSLDGNNKEIPQSGPTVDTDTSLLSSFNKPKEAIDTYAVSCGDEETSKDGVETPPVVFDEITEKENALSAASYISLTSTGSNSEEDAESTTESSTAGDSKVNEVAQVAPTHNGGMLHFSKPRHVSMWNLIHQHMSSNLSVEPANKSVGESPVDDAENVLSEANTALSRESSDKGTNDSETQEVELRKLFAVKLVRQAIEKILLPEVQDQGSDDQSVASESTPRSELIENNQKAFNQEKDAESEAEKVEGDVSSNPKEETVVAGDAPGGEIKESEKQIVRKSEKKAPKHWSNLKKWILLQRFIRELEKVRKFNPKKPQLLPLNPDPSAEKVNLRPQTVDGRKSAEEWMLDHALRHAVSQLAPTQKKKVALLVKAFETVVPTQEESRVQPRIPRLRSSSLATNGNSKVASDDSISIIDSSHRDISVDKAYEVKDGCESSLKSQNLTDARNVELISTEKSVLSLTKCTPTDDFVQSNESIKLEDPNHESGESSLNLDVNEILEADEASMSPVLLPELVKVGNDIGDETEAMPTVEGQSNQMERSNHIKMWHMIYQHVVSGIAEKVGRELLEGGEDDEGENSMSSPASHANYSANDLSLTTDDSSEENHKLRSGLTKSDALKLVKEAVDEILLPEIQDDTQSVTSESVPDQEIGGENIVSANEDSKAKSLVSKKSDLSKSKNWSKLKKLLLLKRSIKALEKAREFKPQHMELLPQNPDPEPEKVDLRQQMMDERKKAEQWMLDYAVQHIVTKLTPARKRRVFMLVEAFEAVVPFPEV